MTGPTTADDLRTSCVLSPDDMARAEAAAAERGVPLERAVVEMGLLAEDQVVWFAAERAGIDLVFPAVDGVDADLLALFPQDLLRRLDALPMLRDDDGALVVAFASPPDAATIDGLAEASGTRVRAVLAAAPRIRRVLGALLVPPAASAAAGSVAAPAVAPAVAPVTPHADVASSTALVRHLTAALAKGADEVRFEPCADGVRVRVRIDGLLRTAALEAVGAGPAIVARARALAGLASATGSAVERATLRLPVGRTARRLALTIVASAHGACLLFRELPPVDVPSHLGAWPLPEDAAAWIDRRLLGPGSGREILIVRGEDDELRRGLLRAVASAADQAGFAVAWVGSSGTAESGPWIEFADGPGVADLVAAARADVVVRDALPGDVPHGAAEPGAAFPLTRRVVLGVPSADGARVDPAAAVIDVSAEPVVCPVCDGLVSDQCGQCRGASGTTGRIVAETRNLPGSRAGGGV